MLWLGAPKSRQNQEQDHADGASSVVSRPSGLRRHIAAAPVACDRRRQEHRELRRLEVRRHHC